MTYSDAIIKRLTDLCVERGITTNKLATLSGITQSTLNSMMRGETKNPKLKTLRKIAMGFNMTVAELLDFPEMNEMEFEDEPYTVTYDEKNKVYNVEGPRIEKMLGYTNLDSEKGFQFFQKFLKTSGILDDLEAMGIEEGDTVAMYDLQFDYYK